MPDGRSGPVGSGPNATVYSGLHAGVPVALKVFPARFDKRTLAVVEREQAALAVMALANSILPFQGVEQLPDGRHALRMELCPQSLTALVGRVGPLVPSDVLVLGHAVAAALAAAHGAGVVHGAVKPANLLFRVSGEPVLADFGVALRQSFPRDTGRSLEGLAPETLRTDTLDERTDLYGLGALLHVALTGRPPLPGRLGEQLGDRVLRLLSTPVPAINRPGVSVELSTLVARLLASDPAHRPVSAALVADRLGEMIAYSPAALPARPLPLPLPPPPPLASPPSSAPFPAPPLPAAPLPAAPLPPATQSAAPLPAAPVPPASPPTAPLPPVAAESPAPAVSQAPAPQTSASQPPAPPPPAPRPPASQQPVSQPLPTPSPAPEPSTVPSAAPHTSGPSTWEPPSAGPTAVDPPAPPSASLPPDPVPQESTVDAGEPGEDFDDFRPAAAGEPSAPVVAELPELDDFGSSYPQAQHRPGPPAAPAATGARHTRRAVLVGGGAVLCVAGIALVLILGSRPDVLPVTQGAAPPSSVALPPSPTAPAVLLELAPPTDLGNQIALSWTSSQTMDYAVIVAGEGEPNHVVIAQRDSAIKVQVDPVRKYCFQVQATDGRQVFESPPKPVRGAVCHS
ncbi:serine/threonine protein kinase [Amycolatopsis sp. H20-H5]|uniref:serine/threonine protein kinase n=1 Tax=Amycolatopsis sp. H20-H5 TaxID=3046309 RepID=UPI002DB8D3F9|nr:protein kinase [Amycolatopsis sp. H20-H5]MEC3981939.1 protein kinase [Amycolatopsis sp. H20-H5]